MYLKSPEFVNDFACCDHCTAPLLRLHRFAVNWFPLFVACSMMKFLVEYTPFNPLPL